MANISLQFDVFLNICLMSTWQLPGKSFMTVRAHNYPIPLLICTWFLKNQVGKIKKLIFVGYTNPVRNRLKIQFVELDFSKLIFQKSSTDQKGEWQNDNYLTSAKILFDGCMAYAWQPEDLPCLWVPPQGTQRPNMLNRTSPNIRVSSPALGACGRPPSWTHYWI